LDVFDVQGRKVKSLINENQPIGNHAVQFDANEFSSGIYFYRLIAGKFESVKRMTLLK
jgi:hypothetical protein